MENGLERVYSEIGRYRPVPWEQIPDLGLYMDQVITFITRIYEPLYGDTTKSYLSAPRINNYVNHKLIPRPTGKKYSRLQIAMLIMMSDEPEARMLFVQFFIQAVPAPILVGGGLSAVLYQRHMKNPPAAKEADSWKRQ